jgi:Peptidase family M28
VGRLLALGAALIAAALIAWADARAPAPAPLGAPATAFSAERAMADVAAIASVPRPVGSAAHDAARDTLLHRMAALGLDPQIHHGVGVDLSKFDPSRAAAGAVDNLVGVLPGKDRAAPALALMAHYDSVPASPGSADDAAGVAAALEIVRAIKARGAPARDVILLITDGEEAGLLGANAFFAGDPMAKRIGFLFNMEARGSAGRVQMFQTGANNGATVALFQKTAVRPQASSLTGFIYEHMPNDTDFTVSRKAGVAGLNYAFIGRQFDYHSPSSTPATTDQGTLQDLGQQVLSTALTVASSPALPAASPDLVFGQIPGAVTLAYPPIVGWLIVAASAGLLAWAMIRARRAEAFGGLDVARGAGAALFAVLSAVAVLHFARRATGVPSGYLAQRFLLAQAPRWETAVFLVGLGMLLVAIAEVARGRRKAIALPLLAGVGSCLFGGLDQIGLSLGLAAAVIGLLAYGRPVSRPGAWAGALLLGIVLAIAAQVAAPPAAFVIAWPVALGALAAAATALAVGRSPATLVLLALLAALSLAFAADLAHTAYLSLDLPELLGLPVLIALFTVWPLAQPDEGAPPARLVGPVLILAGLALTAAVRFNHPYDARHPQATLVGYWLDQDARKAWRFSRTPADTPWTAAVLKAGGGVPAKLSHWALGPVNAAPAPYLDVPAPQMSLSRDPNGDLRLHIAPPPGARSAHLRFQSDTAASLLTVAGAPAALAIKPGKDAQLTWATAAQPLDLTLRAAGPGKLDVAYEVTTMQWPAGAAPVPKRPADLMAFDVSDSAVLTGVRHFSW